MNYAFAPFSEEVSQEEVHSCHGVVPGSHHTEHHHLASAQMRPLKWRKGVECSTEDLKWLPVSVRIAVVVCLMT